MIPVESSRVDCTDPAELLELVADLVALLQCRVGVNEKEVSICHSSSAG